MKRLLIVGISCVVFVFFLIAVFINENNKNEEANACYLRVHIRANSNSESDQAVKYVVKQAVVDYLTPKIAEGSTFNEVYDVLNKNLKNIENVANNVLKENGFAYSSSAKLKEEFFPTRSYGDYTLDADYYDALIVNLGSGNGNNWWCVVYPPLCFIGSEGSSYKNIKYKSKLVEIIENFFK